MTKKRLIEILWMVLEYRLTINDCFFDRYICRNLACLIDKRKIKYEEKKAVTLFLMAYFSNREYSPIAYPLWLSLNPNCTDAFMSENWNHRNNILLDAIAFVESTGTTK